MNPSEFLLARIDEDEAERVTRFRRGHLPTPRELREANRWEAECEAKRRIVLQQRESQITAESDDGAPWAEGMAYAGELAMRDLAAVYADHPDYDEDWRP